MRLTSYFTLTTLLFAPGCAVSDAVFAVFGGHYSGGGTTSLERKQHYDQTVGESRQFGTFRSPEHPTSTPWDASR